MKSLRKYTYLIWILFCYGCADFKKNDHGEIINLYEGNDIVPIQRAENGDSEKLISSWRFIRSINQNKKTLEFYHGQLPFNDTIIEIFSKDFMYEVFFPYNLHHQCKYQLILDSIYYVDNMGNSIVEKFEFRNDTLILTSATPYGTLFKEFVQVKNQNEQIQFLIQEKVDWRYTQLNWFANSDDGVWSEQTLQYFGFRVPDNIDLRASNIENYSFNADTLWYEWEDSVYVYTFRDLWLPGGRWSEPCLVLYPVGKMERRNLFFRTLD